MKQLLLIGLGGFAGSIARHLVSRLNVTWTFFDIPMGTLVVNLTGSLLIGLISGILLLNNSEAAVHLRLLLITGFCGGYTTFSAFTHENLQLIQNGQYGIVVIYSSVSILAGILAVFGGYWIAKSVL